MQSLRFPKVRGTFCLLCGGGTSTNTSHRANTVRVKIMFASVVARLLPSALPPAPSTSPPVSRLYVRGEPHEARHGQCAVPHIRTCEGTRPPEGCSYASDHRGSVERTAPQMEARPAVRPAAPATGLRASLVE